MAAHRYWRILNTANQANSSPTFDTVTMSIGQGQANLATNPASASASSSYSSSYAPSMCILGQSGFWSAGGGVPQWWEYDFGAGNAYDIGYITITAAAGFPDRPPTAAQFQYSDDNITWVTGWTTTGGANWAAGETRGFTSPTAPAAVLGTGPHRYWRVNTTANQANNNVVFDTVTMSTGPGTQNLATNPANAIASSYYNSTTTPAMAVALQPGYWSASSPPASWWGYDFGVGITQDIRFISILSASLTYDNYDRAPTSFTVDSSDDGVTWNNAWTVTGGANWYGGELRTFTSPSAPAALPLPVFPGAHRYWRVKVFATQDGTSLVNTAKVTLATSYGGANIATTSANAFASSAYSSSYAPSLSFHSGPETTNYGYWLSNNVPSPTKPQWVAYDLGLGNAQAIAEVTITVDNTLGTETYPRAPHSFTIDCSDDGVIWSVAGTFTAGTWSNANKTQTFTLIAGGGPKGQVLVMG